MRIFFSCFLILMLTGCTKKVIETKYVKISEKEGTDTGGGGFADQSAVDALNLAKHALAQQIEHLPDKSFEPYYKKDGYTFGLPKGKRKEWLLKIIRGVKIRRVYEKRYDKPLKFNYNPKTEEIYATNYFIQNFSYGRFQNSEPATKIRLLHEIFLDILHEISHFYGVGTSEELDYQSEYWAMDFILYGLDSHFICYSENDYLFKINKATGLVFMVHDPIDPQSTLIIEKTPNHTYKREGKLTTSLFSQTIKFLPREDHWNSHSKIVQYNEYDKLFEQSAETLYQQYIILATMNGKEDIPDYMHPTRQESIWNPHDYYLHFVPQFIDQKSHIPSSGSLFGYPVYKKDQEKYILIKKGWLKRDHFVLDLITNTATYNAGIRNNINQKFVNMPEKKLTLHCQDYNKPIITSTPSEKIKEKDPYWDSYVDD